MIEKRRAKEFSAEHRARLSEAAKKQHAKRRELKAVGSDAFDEYVDSTLSAIRVSNSHNAEGLMKSVLMNAIAKGFEHAMQRSLKIDFHLDEKDVFTVYDEVVAKWT